MVLNRFGGVAGFIVFSQQLFIGYSGLDQVKVNVNPTGLVNGPTGARNNGKATVQICTKKRYVTKPTSSEKQITRTLKIHKNEAQQS